MNAWYQKFLVPPPLPGENRTRVNVSISVTNIQDIDEQVQVRILMGRNDLHFSLQNEKCPFDTGRSFPSSVLPCYELAGLKYHFQGETPTIAINMVICWQNLKNRTSMNTLLTSELYKIWTPELIFVNTVRKEYTSSKMLHNAVCRRTSQEQ